MIADISRKPRHLYKLHGELPVERGHLSLHAQLPPTDGERNDLIVSRAVTDSIEDVQVLHHHVAVQTNIEHLEVNEQQTTR